MTQTKSVGNIIPQNAKKIGTLAELFRIGKRGTAEFYNLNTHFYCSDLVDFTLYYNIIQIFSILSTEKCKKIIPFGKILLFLQYNKVIGRFFFANCNINRCSKRIYRNRDNRRKGRQASCARNPRGH